MLHTKNTCTDITRVDTRPVISVQDLNCTRVSGANVKLITIKDKSYLI